MHAVVLCACAGVRVRVCLHACVSVRACERACVRARMRVCTGIRAEQVRAVGAARGSVLVDLELRADPAAGWCRWA